MLKTPLTQNSLFYKEPRKRGKAPTRKESGFLKLILVISSKKEVHLVVVICIQISLGNPVQKRDFIIIPQKEQLTHCVLTAQCVCVRKEMVVSIVRSNPSLMAATKVVLASPFFGQP